MCSAQASDCVNYALSGTQLQDSHCCKMLTRAKAVSNRFFSYGYSFVTLCCKLQGHTSDSTYSGSTSWFYITLCK